MQRYHTGPGRAFRTGSQRLRAPGKYPHERDPVATFRFPCATPAFHRFDSPRPETPRPVIRDGTADGARPSSQLSLPSLLRRASVLSRLRGTNRHVSGSFHIPSGRLFSFPSKYWCAIGLCTCLGLGVQLSRLQSGIPARPTRLGTTSGISPTGVSPSSPSHSSELRLTPLRSCPSHISPQFPAGIQDGLYPFHSPLLRASNFLSLPAPTMMLHFRALAFGSVSRGAFSSNPRRGLRFGSSPCRFPERRAQARHEVAFGHSRIGGCMRLPGTYRSLPRPSSPFRAEPSPCRRLRIGQIPQRSKPRAGKTSARSDDWDSSG